MDSTDKLDFAKISTALRKKSMEHCEQLTKIIQNVNHLHLTAELATLSAISNNDEPIILPRVLAYFMSLVEHFAKPENLSKYYFDPKTTETVGRLLQSILNLNALASGYNNNLPLNSTERQLAFTLKLQDQIITGKGYSKFKRCIFLGITDGIESNDKKFISGVDLEDFVYACQRIISNGIDAYVNKMQQLFLSSTSLEEADEHYEDNAAGIIQLNHFDVSSLYAFYPDIMDELSKDLKQVSDQTSALFLPGKGTTYSFTPIWKFENRYFIFNLTEFEDNLYAIYLNYLDKKHNNLRDKFIKKRAKYIEKESLSILGNSLCCNASFQSVTYVYNQQQFECDGIISVDGELFIIEAKSHKYNAAALKGVQLSMEKKLKESIKEANEQANRMIQHLRQAHHIDFTHTQGSACIDIDSFSKIHKIIVLFEDLSPLLASLETLQECDYVDKTEAPWVVSLHDLMAICEILDTPALMHHYILMRELRNTRNDIHFHDEMEILGFFLSHGINFPSALPNTNIFQSGNATALDDYFMRGGDKPHFSTSANIQHLLSTLSSPKLDGWLCFSRAILTLPEDNLQRLDDLLGAIARDTLNKQTKKHYSITLSSRTFHFLKNCTRERLTLLAACVADSTHIHHFMAFEKSSIFEPKAILQTRKDESLSCEKV